MKFNNKKAFTLVELLVVISIIALLLSILMPSLSRARDQAKSVVCKSNIKQWGLLVGLYHADNGGYFWTGNNYWPPLFEPYTGKNPDFRYCPSAKVFKPFINQSGPVPDVAGSTFTPWDITKWQPDLTGHTNGSYGLNEWVMNPTTEHAMLERNGFMLEEHWKHVDRVKRASIVPLFADSLWFGGWPFAGDFPPSVPDEWRGGNMQRFCIDRHNNSINVGFVDLTVRDIGLKQLWELKWHKTYDTNGPWTKAGGATAAKWNSAAPWMKNVPFK